MRLVPKLPADFWSARVDVDLASLNWIDFKVVDLDVIHRLLERA